MNESHPPHQAFGVDSCVNPRGPTVSFGDRSDVVLTFVPRPLYLGDDAQSAAIVGRRNATNVFFPELLHVVHPLEKRQFSLRVDLGEGRGVNFVPEREIERHPFSPSGNEPNLLDRMYMIVPSPTTSSLIGPPEAVCGAVTIPRV